MNPDANLDRLLSQKGLKTAPDALLLRIESAIEHRSRIRRRLQAGFISAMAACLVFCALFVSRVGRSHPVNLAQNEAFVNTIFSTFTMADNASDSTYSFLSEENDNLCALFAPEDDSSEVTLVDF